MVGGSQAPLSQMLTLNPSDAATTLKTIMMGGLKTSIMMWGAPGIGKSSIVHSVAKDLGYQVVDVRLSQLAPTDLRGLPYVQEGVAHFAPPSFLPREGKWIIFMDEINLAPPAIQNVAMQLVLDRRVGDYIVPEDCFIIAAGNRVEDRAAVSQMPAPLTNRFLHFTLEVDLNSWKDYAFNHGISDKIISFLNFRPNLLHNFNKSAISWPSPRSWEFASDLEKIGLPVDSAVGSGAAAEYSSFVKLYSKLPDVEKILQGDFSIKPPKEPSMMYAILGSLVARSETADQFFNAISWLIKSTTEDYTGLFMIDAPVKMKMNDTFGGFVSLMVKSSEGKNFIQRYQELLK